MLKQVRHQLPYHVAALCFVPSKLGKMKAVLHKVSLEIANMIGYLHPCRCVFIASSESSVYPPLLKIAERLKVEPIRQEKVYYGGKQRLGHSFYVQNQYFIRYVLYVFETDYYYVEDRVEQFRVVTEAHPNKIPVIVERAPSSQLPDIDRTKYLVSGDLTVAQFGSIIRKRIKLGNEQTLIIYINGTLQAASAMFSTIYEEHKDADGFLYVVYTGESSFGDDA